MACVVKASFNGDVRRISIQPTTFENLKQILQKLFNNLPAFFVIKYQDDDNDLITITTDIELDEALSIATKKNNILRLFLESKVGVNQPAAATPSLSEQPKEKEKVENKPQEPFRLPNLGNPLGFLNTPNVNQFFQEVDKVMKPIMENFQARCPYTGPKTEEAKARCPYTGPKTEEAKARCPYFTQSQNNSEAASGSDVHLSVTCDGCGQSPIIGVRYKCANCGNFDLCSACEAKGVHDKDHVFVKIPRPTSHHWFRPILPNVYDNEHKVFRRTPCRWARANSQGFVPLLARFVADVTIPDGYDMPPNTNFTKVWKLRNEGTTSWPEGCRLVFTDGERMKANMETIVPSVAPCEEISISVDMVAPSVPGKYVGYYRMSTAEGSRFGHRIWVEITVVQPLIESEKIPAPEQKIPAPEVKAVKFEEPVKPVEENYPYAENLQKLANMGFDNIEHVKLILTKNKGALVATLDELLRQ